MHENERHDDSGDGMLRREPTIIDLDRALERLDFDRSLFNEMAGYFLADSPTLLDVIRSGLAAREPEEMVRAAHTLRNLAATCGGERAALAAGTVEQLGIAGVWEQLPAALAQLESQIETLAHRLRGFAWES